MNKKDMSDYIGLLQTALEHGKQKSQSIPLLEDTALGAFFGEMFYTIYDEPDGKSSTITVALELEEDQEPLYLNYVVSRSDSGTYTIEAKANDTHYKTISRFGTNLSFELPVIVNVPEDKLVATLGQMHETLAPIVSEFNKETNVMLKMLVFTSAGDILDPEIHPKYRFLHTTDWGEEMKDVSIQIEELDEDVVIVGVSFEYAGESHTIRFRCMDLKNGGFTAYVLAESQSVVGEFSDSSYVRGGITAENGDGLVSYIVDNCAQFRAFCDDRKSD